MNALLGVNPVLLVVTAAVTGAALWSWFDGLGTARSEFERLLDEIEAEQAARVDPDEAQP